MGASRWKIQEHVPKIYLSSTCTIYGCRHLHAQKLILYMPTPEVAFSQFSNISMWSVFIVLCFCLASDICWHSHAQIHQRNVMHRGRLTCTKCDVKGLECAHHREFYLYVLIKFIDIHENLDPFGSHQSGMYITS